MVGEVAKSRHIRLIVGRGVADHMFLKIIPRQLRLPKAGGAAAVEIAAQVGKRFPTGKTLERQDQMAARSLLYPPQDGGVSFQRGNRNDKHDSTDD